MNRGESFRRVTKNNFPNTVDEGYHDVDLIPALVYCRYFNIGLHLALGYYFKFVKPFKQSLRKKK